MKEHGILDLVITTITGAIVFLAIAVMSYDIIQFIEHCAPRRSRFARKRYRVFFRRGEHS